MPKNLPNLITVFRLVLALVLFVILSLVDAAQARGGEPAVRLDASRVSLLLNLCVVIFALAAFSDWLDGQIARRWGLVTDFGRIVDPFADKVVVCGLFVFLVPLEGSPVSAWMVVMILARELLVDGLRGFAESKGIAFPSMYSGKVKMFVQSCCLGWVLLTLANLRGVTWAEGIALGLLWATLGVTLFSGGVYLWHSRALLSTRTAAEVRAAAGPGAAA